MTTDIFSEAQLYKIPSAEEPGRQALAVYLQEYVRLLQHAGNHVLFRLPQFNDMSYHHMINYSTSVKEFTELDEIFSISIEKINDYISMSWLKAALLAGNPNTESIDRAGVSLAEYKSTWGHDDSTPFHFKFAAPRIRALCNQEVILYFTIDEVLFYESDDFET